jgi:hypothetical protein
MSNDVYNDCRRFALDLAGELGKRPLIVTENQPNWPTPPNAIAYSIRGQSLLGLDMLRERGEQITDWPAMIVFTKPPADEETARGLLLHEVSHLLPLVPEPYDGDPGTEADRERQCEVMAAGSSEERRILPWFQHGWQFLRRIVHLRYRAGRLGQDIPLNSLHAAGPSYGLSHISCYERELGCEPVYSIGKSFAEIEATEPPPRFLDLFRRDMKAFFLEEQAAAFRLEGIAYD